MFRQDIRNIARICALRGVRNAVISPGSRNTPLTMAFTSEKDIQCVSLTDERSAAFFALGIAQSLQAPVALICTSGSAVLNYAPALVEAYYQNLPLIVLTADRPEEWIDQADGQTIRQADIYKNYIKQSFVLPSDRDNENTWHSDRLVSQAIDTSLQYPQGPVHLNVPLKEPLYTALPKEADIRNIPVTVKSVSCLEENELISMNKVWESSSKKLIVTGVKFPDPELKAKLNELAAREDVVVIADNLSNISGKKIVENPDLWLGSLTEEQKDTFKPDLLITIGQSVISKHLKLFLRKNKAIQHWQVEASLPYADTYQSLQQILPVSAIELFGKLSSKSVQSDYASRALATFTMAEIKFQAYLEELNHCDMKSMETILQEIPENYWLQISNSTPIRLSQLFNSREDLKYFCNRGTSGIEGSVSTAAGAAFATQENTLLISGDLSFVYDSNGLWNRVGKGNFKIIVFNNGGANIFRIIGNQEAIADCQEYFDVPNLVDMEMLCKAFGANYYSARTQEELKQQLPVFFGETDQASVLEVKTEMNINTQTFKQLFNALK